MRGTDLGIEGVSVVRVLEVDEAFTRYEARGSNGVPLLLTVLDRLGQGRRTRFERELENARRLRDQPAIVLPYRHGFTGSELPFVANARAQRGTVAEVIERRGPQTWEQSVTYLLPVARVLAIAHREGVVHGDLRPDHVMLDTDGRPQLGGFGLAACLPTGAPVRAADLAHAPPELALDGQGRWQTSTDVYGLASILYTLVAGRPPHVDRHMTSADAKAAVTRRSLTRLNIEHRHNDLLADALDDAPGRRPSAAAFAEALEASLAPPPPVVGRAATPRAASRSTMVGSAVWLGVGLVFALGVFGLSRFGGSSGGLQVEGPAAVAEESVAVPTTVELLPEPVEEPVEEAALDGHDGAITELLVLDGERLVSVAADGSVNVWDPDDPTADAIRAVPTEGAVDRLVPVGADLLVLAGEDGTVEVWEWTDPAAVPVALGDPQPGPVSIAAHPDGRLLTGLPTGELAVWDPTTPDVAPTVFAVHTTSRDPAIDAVVVLAEGRAVTAGADSAVRVVGIDGAAATGTEPIEIKPPGYGDASDRVTAMVALADNRLVASTTEGRLVTWRWPDTNPESAYRFDGTLHGFDLLPDGEVVFLAGTGLGRFDPEQATGRPVALPVIEEGERALSGLEVIDDVRVAVFVDDGSVLIWDIEREQVVQQLAGQDAPVTRIALLADGRLVTGSADGVLRVWGADGSPAGEVVAGG